MYNGKNPDSDNASEKASKSNYWLDKQGEWFELKNCECCVLMNKMTVDEDGFIMGMNYTKKHQTKLENGKLTKIEAIVLHRTEGGDVISAMSNTTLGTHFYVASDGTVYQAASLNKKTQHVGSGLYSKEKDETGEGSYENTWPHNERGKAELNKNYPDRYPTNGESVGIEVAGRFTKTSGKETSGKYKGEDKGEWEALTEKQINAVICLCKVLKKQYKLDNDDIFAHDDIKPKTKGEGSSYINSILKELK